jgi:hypothetical protein
MDALPDRQRAVRSARYKYIRNAYPERPAARRGEFREHLDLMQELWRAYQAGELDTLQRRWFEARAAEELYDLRADPHELHNLSDAPEHAEALAELRDALDSWQALADPYGEWPEERLRAHLWPSGSQPQTPPPEIRVGATDGDGSRMLRLECEEPGASIGYRLSGGSWQVYALPFRAPLRGAVEARAVRYGWEASRSVTLRFD